ncbi:MAG: membrane-bound PQQ-dependent dehydrogenase, glucose/quinate/shikimate family [Steroidobacteraceae bacterium]
MKSNRMYLRVFSIVLALLGLTLLVGGIKLFALGGSWWYACSGVVLIASATLLWLGNRWGSWVYGFMLAYTLAWSIWEVGFNGWALVPRLAALTVLGLWFLTPFVQRGLIAGPPPFSGKGRALKAGAAVWTWGAITLAAATAIGIALTHVGPVIAQDAPVTETASTAAAGEWRHYGNDTAGTRYSELTQIKPDNVEHLKLAWSFRTGDIAQPGQGYSFEATPLKIDHLLYLCTPSGQVFALEAATGKVNWHFDAKSDVEGVRAFTCRGVSYYSTGLISGECAQRIYVTTPDAKLWGIDALTGKPCAQFGEGGAVDLLAGLGEVPKGMYAVTSPPVVTHGKLILGSKVQDNISTDMPSGVVRAFDAVTGKLAWAWDVGQPDRRDAPPPGETYTRSTPNAWAPLVADDALGLVYIPTGNPAADFWGKKRRSFDERYNDALVAVDVSTGETRWSFQATHHDLWDNDLAAQPVLVDMPTAQGVEPAVILGSKQGDIFVLNRKTGEPIVPVTEKPVPGSSNIGEKLSATQPASALAVNPGPSLLTEAAMWGATPIDQMWCRIQYRQARYEGPYTPNGTGQPTIVYPGPFGGIEWGGVTVDPVRKILISNPSAMPFLVKMAKVRSSSDPIQSGANKQYEPEGVPAGLREMKGTGYAVSFEGFLSPLKVPCMQPPWGKLYAIDLQTHQVIWERPVGSARDTGPLGIASHLPLLIGTPQIGGTIITRGGLIFSGATLDQYFRAYDVQTGKELWKARLPAGGQATPMTYQADGRQFVVISAGGHGILGTKTGDHVLAYALD